jgi:hypothetical protein
MEQRAWSLITKIIFGSAQYAYLYLNVAKTSREQIRHSRESGNPAREPGFRVKPGMTEAKGLRK